MRKGAIELCVLGALREGEAYGYQILQQMGSVDGMAVTESTVYPILARLAKDRLVSVRVADSPAGPPRRYYRLTPEGRERLKEMKASWNSRPMPHQARRSAKCLAMSCLKQN